MFVSYNKNVPGSIKCFVLGTCSETVTVSLRHLCYTVEVTICVALAKSGIIICFVCYLLFYYC
jgi:hypothetical protein